MFAAVGLLGAVTIGIFAFCGRGSLSTVSAASKSASASPVLVELFTSEGCSSCPPADALLREISGRVSSGGHPIIVLSEHVTYWNQLGWHDPFSAESLTQRQSDYGQRFGLDSVYTPQAVVNGRAEMVGSRKGAVLSAIDEQPAAALNVKLTGITRSEGALQVTAVVNGPAASKGATLLAAVTDDEDQTRVLRGENAGETLRHAMVVRSLVPLGTVMLKAEEAAFTVPLPAAYASQPGKHHLVLFAQAAGNGPVLGVDTRAID